MTGEQLDSWRDFALGSILTSRFLLCSLGFHLFLFYVVGSLVLSARPERPDLSIPISLIEFGEGRSPTMSIGSKRGSGGPRALPKLGTPVVSREAVGKLDTGSAEVGAAEAKATSNQDVEPRLPGPKVLAAAPTPVSRLSQTTPDSLVRLPTKEILPSLPDAVNSAPSRRGTTGRDTEVGEGVRALRDGAEIPGSLKGVGNGTGPYGVPGGVRDGKGTSGGGTGTALGGGSSSGLRGKFNEEYSHYLKSIEKRVYTVWKYPDGASGVQKVSVRFALDRAGKLTQAEVVDSTDPKINASAIEAMKKASPFPPIPERLKDLADEPLIIRFTIAVRISG